jgi:hypothetical protein
MFSIVQLKSAALDFGVPGISRTLTMLIFLMMFAIPAIPYVFLYFSLRDKKSRPSPSSKPSTIRAMTAWLHAHHHPHLLHH